MDNPFPYEAKLSGYHDVNRVCHDMGLVYLKDYIYRSSIEFGSRDWTITINFREISDLVLFKITI